MIAVVVLVELLIMLFVADDFIILDGSNERNTLDGDVILFPDELKLGFDCRTPEALGGGSTDDGSSAAEQ